MIRSGIVLLSQKLTVTVRVTGMFVTSWSALTQIYGKLHEVIPSRTFVSSQVTKPEGLKKALQLEAFTMMAHLIFSVFSLEERFWCTRMVHNKRLLTRLPENNGSKPAPCAETDQSSRCDSIVVFVLWPTCISCGEYNTVLFHYSWIPRKPHNRTGTDITTTTEYKSQEASVILLICWHGFKFCKLYASACETAWNAGLHA